MDFFDDEDDAQPSDQPTRESRRIHEPGEEESVAPPPADPEPRAERPRPRPRPRQRPSRSIADDPVPAGAGGPPSRSQIRSRQLTLLGVAIVVLILLFLAFRGCQNARTERSFENYVSDLSALTVETKQLSDQFFGALQGKSDTGDIDLINQVNGDRGTAQSLLDRAENLDNPDDLAQAQTQIALAYQLRRDALDVIADVLPDAGSNDADKQKQAAEKIQEQMQVLLASDVLYNRARFEIENALNSQEIVVDEGVPESDFLPKDPDFLDLSVIETALSTAGGGSSDLSNCDPDDGGIHGLELTSTTAQPSGTVLQPEVENSVPADGTEFEIAVTNGGDATESDIDVTMDGDLTGQQTISSIEAAETATVTIPPKPAPKPGDSVEITVSVALVCGEQIDSNNESTYPITFG